MYTYFKVLVWTIKNYGMTLWAEFITLGIATIGEHTILNSHIP